MDHSGEALDGRLNKLCSPDDQQKARILKAEEMKGEEEEMSNSLYLIADARLFLSLLGKLNVL